MLKRLLKGSAIYAFSDLLRKLAPFILLPLFVTNLSVEEFGRLEYITVISTLFAYLVGWGSVQGLLRLYVEDGPKYTFITLQIVTASSLLLILCMLFLSWVFDFVNYLDLESIQVLYICTLYGWLFAVTNVAFTILRIEERLKEFAAYNLLSTLIQVITISFFLIILKLGFLSKVYGLVISYSLMFLILSIMVLRKKINVIFSLSLIKSALSFFTPITFNNLLGWLGSSLDKLAVKALLGDEALGIYSFIHQLVQIFKLGFESFLKSLNVLLYKNYDMQDVLDKHQFLLIGVLQVIAMAYVSVIILMSAQGVFSNYNVVLSVLVMLMLSRTLMLANYLEVLRYYVEINSKTVLKANVVAAVVLTASVSIFVDQWGALGAAFSVVLSTFSNYTILSWRKDRKLDLVFKKLLISVVPWGALLFVVV